MVFPPVGIMEVPSFWTLGVAGEADTEAAIMEEKKLVLASCIFPGSIRSFSGALSISPTVSSSSRNFLDTLGSTCGQFGVTTTGAARSQLLNERMPETG